MAISTKPDSKSFYDDGHTPTLYEVVSLAFVVNSKTSSMIFVDKESAQFYLNKFPPSISGGMFINTVQIFKITNATKEEL
jgi:hypothetical protein